MLGYDFSSLLGLEFADYVVLAAGVTFCIGYAVINQLILRLLVMTGTLLYIWYYSISADTPQWAAIWTSVAMAIANIIGLVGLWLRNSTVSIPRRHHDIYSRFQLLPPGDFRKLMTAANRQTLPEGFELTTQGKDVDSVYFVLRGGVAVEKNGESFDLPEGIFLGEVGYLTGKPASATTVLSQDSDVVIWTVRDLKNRSRRDVRFKLAMDAVISLDLADKVARAGSPRQTPPQAKADAATAANRNIHNSDTEVLNLRTAGSK